MNARRFILAIAMLAVLAPAGTAHADDVRQVWRDTEGQIVHNTWGNCVRSRWITDTDACAIAPPPERHTVIAREDRTVYFEFNKATLSDESRTRLDTLANKVQSADDVEGVDIVGYADRIGTVTYNEALSKRRAETVRAYLATHGLVKPSTTHTKWVGKSEPSADCPDTLSHAQLVDCLQPDRKVTVDMEYREETDESGAPVNSDDDTGTDE
jgi:outer membrane protein OmpA-like peptidoglycan-associated protein